MGGKHSKSGSVDVSASKGSPRYPLVAVSLESEDMIIANVVHRAAWDESFGSDVPSDLASGAKMSSLLGEPLTATVCALGALLRSHAHAAHCTLRWRRAIQSVGPSSFDEEYVLLLTPFGKGGGALSGGCCGAQLMHLWLIPAHLAMAERPLSNPSPLFQCPACEQYSADGGCTHKDERTALLEAARDACVMATRPASCVMLHTVISQSCKRCKPASEPSSPLTTTAAGVPIIQLAPTPANTHPPIIAVIEWDPVRRNAMKTIVADMGYIPFPYAHCDEALSQIVAVANRTGRFPVDAIVLEMSDTNEHMSALDFLRALSESAASGIPVLAVGSSPEFGTIAVRLGATAYACLRVGLVDSNAKKKNKVSGPSPIEQFRSAVETLVQPIL